MKERLTIINAFVHDVAAGVHGVAAGTVYQYLLVNP